MTVILLHGGDADWLTLIFFALVLLALFVLALLAPVAVVTAIYKKVRREPQTLLQLERNLEPTDKGGDRPAGA